MAHAVSPEMTVGVVGAGTMGAGIAQVAAGAGHPVLLFDAAEGAPDKALGRIAESVGRRVAGGKLAASERDALLSRLVPVRQIEDLAPAGLIVEAIVEDLAAKQALFRKLEGIVAADVLLCSNTSSISITAIGAALARPERLAGMHFFNPAPAMCLVEVVSGLATDGHTAAGVAEIARAWGKEPVQVRSAPGFIVNRVARPFYGEAFRVVEEQIANPETIDLIMTESAGFPMGPFALTDLIGQDVNAAVTRTIFEAFGFDPRYRPSLVQAELIAAGRLGRKSGRGFFDYRASQPADRGRAGQLPAGDPIQLDLPLDGTATLLGEVLVVRTDGRTATERADKERRPVILHDLVGDPAAAKRVGLTASPDVPDPVLERVADRLRASGVGVSRLADRPGLVAMRTVAMLVNEAFEAALQGIASLDDIDRAMQLGVNYPRGPFAWGRALGLGFVAEVIDNIRAATGDPRYRTSLGLRLAAGAETIARRSDPHLIRPEDAGDAPAQ